MDYTQRLHQFVGERTWTVGDDALTWRDAKGGGGRVPYSGIRSVRLRFEPTRAERRRYAMRIDAGTELAITNIHYAGIYDFKDQSEQFRPFVEAFHEKLRVANPNATYLSGSTPAAYVMNILLTIWIIAMLAIAAIFFFSIGVGWLVVLKVALILFFMPALFSLLKKNKPSTYDPQHIPESLVPSVAS